MYGTNLEALARRTSLTWSMSAFDILRKHTVFPYYTFFFSKNYLDALNSFTTPTRYKAGAYLNRSVPAPKYLRYCRSCVRHDTDRLGETYWKRRHQLSGVLLCTEHNEILVDSPVHSKSLDKDLYDATTASLAADPIECVTLTERDRRAAMDIARRCQDLITSAPLNWLRPSLHPFQLYRRAAIELGYGWGTNRLNSQRIAHDFYEFYGSEFLSKFGIKILSRNSQAEILLNGGVHHPLLHVLMQRFLDQRLEEFQPNRNQFFQVRCPNRYAEHPADFSVKNVVRMTSAPRGEYFIGHCTCGYGFSFQRTEARDPTMPVVLRQTLFGETFEREARRLYKETPSVEHVARTMGVSHMTANRLIKGHHKDRSKKREKSKHDADQLVIARLRSEWQKSKSKKAYGALWRRDRDWILAQQSRPTRKPRPTNNEEDASIASEIRESARALLSATPPRRVTRHAICVHIGRPRLVDRLPRLPLAQSEMSKATESIAEWHNRKTTIEGTCTPEASKPKS